MVIERERDCDPVPHDFVHVVHALNAVAAQWIGHGPWLHGLVRLEKPAAHGVFAMCFGGLI